MTYTQYFQVREILFKTKIGNTLKYCIAWLDWDINNLSMISKECLSYTEEELKDVKTWSQYKKEINYNSTFNDYAIENNINLNGIYYVFERSLEPRNDSIILKMINLALIIMLLGLHVFFVISTLK